MADEQTLARLAGGLPTWNKWRESAEVAKPDLRNADLHDADLHGANLIGVILDGANLVSARLSGANLSFADMSGADLRDADLGGSDLFCATLNGAQMAGANLVASSLTSAQLTGANLRSGNLVRADLTGAVFTDADLTEVNLGYTNLSGADFTGADLSLAILEETVLSNVDLSGVKGLETCRHLGPSTIDHRTLFLSGVLPLSFLRGCGLPDRLIDYLPSLIEAGPIQFYSCFISHSTADEEFARRLHADLQDRGVRCWFAPHDMRPGQKIHEQIDEAIRLYDRLLLILSRDSMNSSWVKTEIAKARAKEVKVRRRVLFPLALVPYEEVKAWEQFNADLGEDTAREIREYYLPNFSEWKDHDTYQPVFETVVNALKSRD